MTCRMGPQNAPEYTDEFRKYLINCIDMLEFEAKFIFEMDLVD